MKQLFIRLLCSFCLLGLSAAHATPPFQYTHPSGGTIPANSQCAAFLSQVELLLGRPLTSAEITARLKEILDLYGEKLEPAPRPNRPNCFTAQMKVWTKRGDRAIDSLRPGDEVFSLDVDKGHLVINRVRQVFSTNDQTYGRLQGSCPLLVTPRERFFSRRNERNAYVAIEDLAPTDLLFRRDFPQPRGIFEPEFGRATVWNLEMENAPHNFFVEGYLVHNIKVKF